MKYFSFYNQETKKSFWLRDAQVLDGLRVRSYESGRGVVLADNAGALINLAMKETRIRGADGNAPGSSQPNSLLAFSPGTPVRVQVAVAVSEAESRRLEEVSEQVRQRRAQRAAQSGGKT
ncbi:MAG: hypothetical protein WDM96_17475 [Lacunisphaera sp.]